MNTVDAVLGEMSRILTYQVSVLMGIVSVVIMLTVLIFNHYSWRRAFILSAISFLGVTGWYILKIYILGSAIHSRPSLTETALTVLLVFFVVVGYLTAGLISSLMPLPLVKLRRALRISLLGIADAIDSTRWSIGTLFARLSETLHKGGLIAGAVRKFASSIPETYEKDPDEVIKKDIHPLVLELVSSAVPASGSILGPDISLRHKPGPAKPEDVPF